MAIHRITTGGVIDVEFNDHRIVSHGVLRGATAPAAPAVSIPVKRRTSKRLYQSLIAR